MDRLTLVALISSFSPSLSCLGCRIFGFHTCAPLFVWGVSFMLLVISPVTKGVRTYVCALKTRGMQSVVVRVRGRWRRPRRGLIFAGSLHTGWNYPSLSRYVCGHCYRLELGICKGHKSVSVSVCKWRDQWLSTGGYLCLAARLWKWKDFVDGNECAAWATSTHKS